MKISWDLSVISNRLLATCIALPMLAAAVMGWPVSNLAVRMVLGLFGLLSGTVVWQRRVWLVRHSASNVLQQLQQTLKMSCIDHHLNDNSVHLVSTGTKVKVHGWKQLSLVEFVIVDCHSNRERFLVEVLTKYLRFIGKKDSDG